ncbi:MAG: hypothetical protein Q8S21_06610 [Candidatus Paracaedibacteraceae bacterium]|nr:hypothetical protein [Candidatus Paracaedibacteraceae bacterium]
MNMHSKIIDCTFRDGGYYTDWHFDKSLVEETLDVLSRLPVEYVEIGFRKYKDKNELGPNLYTTEEYINSLVIPKGQKIALMLTLKDFDGYTNEEIISVLIPKKDSRVDLIRVGVDISMIEKGIDVCLGIQRLGYAVSINLIHLTDFSLDYIKSSLEHIKKTKFDMVYLADTFGNILPEALATIIDCTREFSKSELGFHAHNNRGLALENTFCAISKGVTWIDSTLTGIGRGAGNISTETLLIELDGRHKLNLDFQELFRLNETYFIPMREKCRWGYNAYYHFGSFHGAHPTHIQSLLANSALTIKEKIEFIKTGKTS